MIRVIASAQLHLSDEEKLKILIQADRWRVWRSLDDQRLCLGCGRLINGHEVDTVQEDDGNGPIKLHCPTPGCQSIPLDWILPNPHGHHANS